MITISWSNGKGVAGTLMWYYTWFELISWDEKPRFSQISDKEAIAHLKNIDKCFGWIEINGVRAQFNKEMFIEWAENN